MEKRKPCLFELGIKVQPQDSLAVTRVGEISEKEGGSPEC